MRHMVVFGKTGQPADPIVAALWTRLVEQLVRAGTLRSPRIVAAFQATPRSAYVPSTLAEAAVTVDAPLPIGGGQTVSQPTTVATMLELVQPRSGDRVLDIGTGSGWQAALLAHCVGTLGRVVSVERIPELAEHARETLAQTGRTNAHVLLGDASDGLPEQAPYDVIISAASSKEIPAPWIEQLAPGGRLLHPIAGMGLRVLRKDETGKISLQDHLGYVFVPLVSGE